MQSVITVDQAKKITGGRTPNMPVEYEQAVKSLQACIDLDDAKIWSDKADALAAWAKVYRSNEAALKAKQLKLHAYRKMGELALELRPRKPKTGAGKGGGGLPGPRALLMELGLQQHQANAAAFLRELPQEKFKTLIESPAPPSPTSAYALKKASSPEWRRLDVTLSNFVSATRSINASIGSLLTATEQAKAKRMMVEASEWLDEFGQRLPK